MKYRKSAILILVLAATLTACATATTKARFYTLANSHSPNLVVKSQTENVPNATPIAIEVLPVNVPERLKRPQLVITTKDSAQLKILEQDRWSSSFNDELQDAFVSGISNQLNAIDLSNGGRVANQPVYRIAIVLQQFNAMLGEQVQANFGWTITRLDSNVSKETGTINNRALSCQSTISKAVGSDINAIVKGVQAMVANAIQAISANVTSLNNGEAGKCAN